MVPGIADLLYSWIHDPRRRNIYSDYPMVVLGLQKLTNVINLIIVAVYTYENSGEKNDK